MGTVSRTVSTARRTTGRVVGLADWGTTVGCRCGAGVGGTRTVGFGGGFGNVGGGTSRSGSEKIMEGPRAFFAAR